MILRMHRFWHPSGVRALFDPFRGYQSLRFVQPPATFFHPSGMLNRGLSQSRQIHTPIIAKESPSTIC